MKILLFIRNKLICKIRGCNGKACYNYVVYTIRFFYSNMGTLMSVSYKLITNKIKYNKCMSEKILVKLVCNNNMQIYRFNFCFSTTTKRLSVDQTNPSQPKRDDDYKNQIPGPIPTQSQSYDDKKKLLKKRNSTIRDKINKNPVDLVAQKESLTGKSVKIDNSDNDISDNKTSDRAKSDIQSNCIKPVLNEEELTKKFPTKTKQETTSAKELAAAKNDSYASYVIGYDVIETPPQSVGSRTSKEKLTNAQADLAGKERVDGIIDDFGKFYFM